MNSWNCLPRQTTRRLVVTGNTSGNRLFIIHLIRRSLSRIPAFRRNLPAQKMRLITMCNTAHPDIIFAATLTSVLSTDEWMDDCNAATALRKHHGTT